MTTLLNFGDLFLGGTYRRQVLGLLLLHPDETFHLREIARLTTTQPGTLRRELATLANAGVITREALGNQARYRANPAFPLYDELRSILKKTTGAADVLRAALAPLKEKIVSAFIYGSVASGHERQASDIDILAVGAVTFEELIEALHPVQQQLRREINPHIYSPNEFVRKNREKNSFISRIMAAPKIFILGNDDELGKLEQNRKSQSA